MMLRLPIRSDLPASKLFVHLLPGHIGIYGIVLYSLFRRGKLNALFILAHILRDPEHRV